MKLFLLFLFVMPLLANAHTGGTREMTFYSLLVDENAHPKVPLSQLLFLLNVPHENTLDSIVAATQKRWLQTGKERWEFQELEEEKKQQLIPLFEQIGLFDESRASFNEYDYALVYGGFYSRVQQRIQHLIKEYERGIRFNEVILLTGQRYLDPNTNEKSLPFRTETEMMLFVWENSNMPQGLRDIPMRVIDAPRLDGGASTPTEKFSGVRLRQSPGIEIVEEGGSIAEIQPPSSTTQARELSRQPNPREFSSQGTRRPGTKETLIEWLESQPEPGRCLFISSQPFCGYQDSVARTYLPSSFEIETIGPNADEEIAVSIFLDNLARWLYQEKIRRLAAN